MAKFEETPLYQALTAETKDVAAIKEALGSAAVNFALRSATGRTYVHLAANNLIGNDFPEVWDILLSQCNMFTRDSNGISGLDVMIDNLPVAWSNKYLKAYLLKLSSETDKIDGLPKLVGMSGKTLHLRRLAQFAKADKAMIEKLTLIAKVEEEMIDVHKGLRNEQDSRELTMSISRKQQVIVPDLTGLPSLHIATVHGLKDSVSALLTLSPEAVNAQDNMGRTALHYAVCMKGEIGEAIVKALTDAKADGTIEDVTGKNVESLKAAPLDMDEFMSSYKTNLERQSASEMMYRVHEAVVSGDLRSVKMALNRRELVTKQDASKLTPLHKAVILKYTAIATWIAQQFKASMDMQGNSGLTPMHFAAALDKDLYETLKQAGGDCHTVDIEGNDPEYYKDHASDFILNIDALREELLVTPPSRPVTAASERAKSAKSAAGKPEDTDKPAEATVQAPPIIMASSKKAPPPETLDAKYIADVLGGPLTAALAEVAEKRPWDPIEYLAQWLYKHKANLNYHQQQLDAVKEAEMEEIRKKEEAENRARRRREAILLKEQEEEKKKKAEEEARKQKEQEELQKKAKESIQLAQPPELATVAEDEETPEQVAITPRKMVEKDEQGRTQLHTLVASGGSIDDVTALLTASGVDLLAEKDAEGKTAKDLAESDEMRECVDSFIIKLVKAADEENVMKLVANGYPLDSLNINPEEQELSEAATQLLTKASDMPKMLEAMSNSIRLGNLAAVKEKLANKSMAALARLNAHGAISLHVAVLHEKEDIVQHLVTAYPGILESRDYLNRTALHYAHSIANEEKRDAIVKILTDCKADAEAADYRGKKPQDYQELTEEMEAMKEAPVPEQASAEGEQAPAEGEQAPAEGEQAPAEGEQVPAEGEQAPAEGEQAPTEGEQAPAEGEQAATAPEE